MNYLDFRKIFKNQEVFSFDGVRLLYPDFDSIQLTRWQKKGYIRSIIKGWYLFTDVEVTESLLMFIANKLVVPSYISLEFAFSLYRFIPEGVFQLTSITSKKTQSYQTDLATFNYRHLKSTLMFGYHLQETAWGKINVADKEKALLDYLYLNPKLNNVAAFEGMRLEKEECGKLNKTKLKRYLAIFNKKSLVNRLERFLDYVAY